MVGQGEGQSNLDDVDLKGTGAGEAETGANKVNSPARDARKVLTTERLFQMMGVALLGYVGLGVMLLGIFDISEEWWRILKRTAPLIVGGVITLIAAQLFVRLRTKAPFERFAEVDERAQARDAERMMLEIRHLQAEMLVASKQAR